MEGKTMKVIIDDYIYYTVKFNLDTVKQFVDVIYNFYAEIDAYQGKYIVDAKSILGMHSLNLLKPVTIKVYKDDLSEEERHALDVMLLPILVQKN